jgi:hypothetical protein
MTHCLRAYKRGILRVTLGRPSATRSMRPAMARPRSTPLQTGVGLIAFPANPELEIRSISSYL